MSVVLAEATVRVTADVSSVGSEAEAGIKKQSGILGGIGSVMGGVLGANLVQAGVQGIKDIFTAGLSEAKEASAVQAQLAAGIKSTGGAAGVTIGQLNSQATALSKMSGQTINSIGTAQSLLLTFTNIKNSGPDKIFNAATLAATNMAAKFGGDASSNSILLGKALNDPTKGLTALTRVGVSFTQSQRDQIAAMQKAGNVVGAQKIILGELNTEFGKSAKAAGDSLPGSLAKLKNGFDEAAGGVVKGLMPAILKLLPVISSIINAAVPVVSTLIPPILGIVKAILPLIQQVLPLLAQLLKPILSLFGEIAKPIIALIGPLLTPLIKLLGAILTPVIKLLTPELKILAMVLTPIADILGVVIGWVADAINWFVKWLTSAGTLSAIGDFFKALGKVISIEINGIITVVTNVVDFFKTAWADVVAGVNLVGNTFSNVFKGIGGFIQSTFMNAVGFVRTGVNGIIGIVNGAIGAIDKLKVTIPGWVPIIGGQTWSLGIPKLPLLATGTNNAPNAFIAGERGPELVTGAAGATVRPYSATKDILAGGRGGKRLYIGKVILDAHNVKDFMDIVDMFDELEQTARSGPGTGGGN